MLEQVIQKFTQQLPWSDKAQMLQKVLQSKSTGVCSWLPFPQPPCYEQQMPPAQPYMP